MKIPKALSIERRRKVWYLRTKGWTYEDIAQEIKISMASVSKILNRATKLYSEKFIEDVKKVKTEQVGILNKIASDAYKAWEASNLLAGMHDGSNGGTFIHEADPRNLQACMKALDEIRKILGANYADTASKDIKIKMDTLTEEDRKKLFSAMSLNEKLTLVQTLIKEVEDEEVNKKEEQNEQEKMVNDSIEVL